MGCLTRKSHMSGYHCHFEIRRSRFPIYVPRIVTKMLVVFLIPFKEKQRRKVHPTTGPEGPDGEYKHSSTLPLTSALDGVGGQRHGPAALRPEMTRYPLYRRLGGPWVRSGREGKILPEQGFDPRTVQPVASRYTVFAIPAYRIISIKIKLKTLLRLRAELYLLPQLTMSSTKLKACCVGPLRQS